MARWDPFREVGGCPFGTEMGFSPCFDVTEPRAVFVIEADLPGIAEKDLRVSLTGNPLTVEGKREHEEVTDDETQFANERAHCAFVRSFTLPEGVNAEKIAAEPKDGVLTLMLPERPEMTSRSIPVRVNK